MLFSRPIGLHLQSPAPASDARTHLYRTMLSRLVVVLIALGILYVRMPNTFSNPQFWGEDVDFFFQAHSRGWAALTIPMAGYFVTVQRLVALFANYLDPTIAPAIYNYAAIALTLAVVFLITSPRLDMPGKPLLALAVVVVPMGYEELGTITNIQWILPFGAFAILFMRPSRSAIVLPTEGAFLALMAVSGPFSIFFVPLFLWRVIALWNTPHRRRLIALTIVVGLGALAQLLSIVTHGEATDPVPPAPYSWMLWANLPLSKFMTTFGSMDRFPLGIGGVVLGILFAAAAIALACRAPYRTQKLFMLGLGLIIALSGMYKWRSALGTQLDAQRYFYSGSVFSLWFICCLANRPVTRFASLAFVALVEVTLLPKVAHTPRIVADLEWPAWARHLSSGLPIVIPTSPTGFYVGLPAATDGPFARYASWIGQDITRLAAVADPSLCAGRLDAVDAVSVSNPQSFADPERLRGLWTVKGLAWDTVQNRPVPLVAIADSSGRVLGFGMPGFKPTSGSPKEQPASGWAATFNAEPKTKVRAFAILNDSPSICLLMKQRSLSPTIRPLASAAFVRGAVVMPGQKITQRFKPVARIESISVPIVTWGNTPSNYVVDWRVLAHSNGQSFELGRGALETTNTQDWLPVELSLSLPMNVPDEIEVSFYAEAGIVPKAPIGFPLYRPVPGSAEIPVELDGVPDKSGAQIGLNLSYGE